VNKRGGSPREKNDGKKERSCREKPSTGPDPLSDEKGGHRAVGGAALDKREGITNMKIHEVCPLTDAL